MKWKEIVIYTTDDGIEAVCAALTGAGLGTLSIEESKEVCAESLERNVKYWDYADMENIGTDRPCVKAYVSEGEQESELIEAATSAIERLRSLDERHGFGELAIEIYEVDEQDWANNWKKYYKPQEIGKRLLVLPSWEEVPETERVILKLDPGMAFGTGAHHTTRMCLELLEGCVQRDDTVLDLGCGSGILSIAARLLGARAAVAADIDPITRSIAAENAELNGIGADSYEILIGDILSDKGLQNTIEERAKNELQNGGKYPIVIANIVADVIIPLSPIAKRLTQKGGLFIASGIIDDRLSEVITALKSAGFTLLKQLKGEDWNALLCQA
ncbi:MAG: 50S ribosomal protein L11 methyltransferase [Clostridia bacterium]|nr:50S ribosomal protein L11 methyltransferase [Clostridia bacterium]